MPRSGTRTAPPTAERPVVPPHDPRVPHPGFNEDEPDPAYGHVRTVDAAALHRLGERPGWRADVHDHHGGWLVLDRTLRHRDDHPATGQADRLGQGAPAVVDVEVLQQVDQQHRVGVGVGSGTRVASATAVATARPSRRAITRSSRTVPGATSVAVTDSPRAAR